MRTKHQFRIRDASPDRQPKKSVILGEGDSSKNYRDRLTTTADLRSSFRQIPHASGACLLEDKIQGLRYVLVHNFYGKLCCGSEKWILVDSVDDVKSSLSERGIRTQDFEVLDAKVA